jgi:2-polyprenyl-3-methyl-5-hydroxy-6-metoxy-1,4-benzoquinol methylase
MSENLTNEKFWENYWGTLKLPITVDKTFKNDNVIANTISESIPKIAVKSALEIGCAPGKWLSFLAREFNCQVTGIEYVEIAAHKTVENLTIQKINDFQIINDDFFNHSLTTQFDLVISLGFIEHFSDYEKVMEDQLKLVSPKGYLVVGLPRFKGINYFLQKGIDRFIQNKLIDSHNLETMNLKVFETFAKKRNLTLVTNKFIGGFEPGLFPAGEISNTFMRVFFKILLRLNNLLFGTLNSSFAASYQIAIFKK